ncbi:AAA family ATPase [Ferrimonas aestuarii]|uniref:Pilus assembly protein CpaE n=1 Tax=Ferrimonas aestuarii TaxID=2569539 RepID=A0A4U1BSS4_9GAMM|nr:hypothetical protein [Ferrimonas aestuarii]TKB58420.1 hypothetical protein FCL42_01345 [Ferrimonas aestuarii]
MPTSLQWETNNNTSVSIPKKIKALPAPVRALLVAANPIDQTEVVKTLKSTPNLTLDSHPINQLNTEILRAAKLLILIVPSDQKQAVTLIQSFSGKCANMLVLGKEISAELMRTAMQCGANDFIALDAPTEELSNAIYTIASALAEELKLAPTIAVVNAKGGAGASFISTAIADCLCMRDGGTPVALIDGDHLHGNQMLLLNKQPQYYFQDALSHVEQLEDSAITGFMSQIDNIHLLPTLPFSQLDSDHFQFNNLPNLLFKIRAHYPSVTVDLSQGPDHWSVPILTDAQFILLVIQDSVACIRDAAAAVRYFTMQLGISKDRIHLIFNRFDKSRAQISVEDVIDTIGIRSVFTVRNDFKRASCCADEGKRLSSFAPKEAITKDIHAICDALLPDENAPNQQGLWAKLWRK